MFCLSNFCSVCLKKKGKNTLYNLNKKTKSNDAILAKLKNCKYNTKLFNSNINIYICNDCQLALDVANKFIMECQKSNRCLKTYIDKLKIKKNNKYRHLHVQINSKVEPKPLANYRIVNKEKMVKSKLVNNPNTERAESSGSGIYTSSNNKNIAPKQINNNGTNTNQRVKRSYAYQITDCNEMIYDDDNLNAENTINGTAEIQYNVNNLEELPKENVNNLEELPKENVNNLEELPKENVNNLEELPKENVNNLEELPKENDLLVPIAEVLLTPESTDVMFKIGTLNGKGRNSFYCTKCSYSSLKKPNIIRHFKLMHGLKRYRCGMCTAEFSKFNNLSRHIRKHATFLTI